jgi:hypothetical protein
MTYRQPTYPAHRRYARDTAYHALDAEARFVVDALCRRIEQDIPRAGADTAFEIIAAIGSCWRREGRESDHPHSEQEAQATRRMGDEGAAWTQHAPGSLRACLVDVPRRGRRYALRGAARREYGRLGRRSVRVA